MSGKAARGRESRTRAAWHIARSQYADPTFSDFLEELCLWCWTDEDDVASAPLPHKNGRPEDIADCFLSVYEHVDDCDCGWFVARDVLPDVDDLEFWDRVARKHEPDRRRVRTRGGKMVDKTGPVNEMS
jgi:hypothetical protein